MAKVAEKTAMIPYEIHRDSLHLRQHIAGGTYGGKKFDLALNIDGKALIINFQDNSRQSIVINMFKLTEGVLKSFG